MPSALRRSLARRPFFFALPSLPGRRRFSRLREGRPYTHRQICFGMTIEFGQLTVAPESLIGTTRPFVLKDVVTLL